MPIVPTILYNQLQNTQPVVPPPSTVQPPPPQPVIQRFNPGAGPPVPSQYGAGNEWGQLSTWASSNISSPDPWVRGSASVVQLFTNPVGWYTTPKVSLSESLVSWGQTQSAHVLAELGGPSNPWARGTSNAVGAFTSYVGGLGGSIESMVNPYTPNLIGSLFNPGQKQYMHDNPYYNIGSYVGEMALIVPGAESLWATAYSSLPSKVSDVGAWLKTGFTQGNEKMVTVTKWAEYPLSTKLSYSEELSPKGLFTLDRTERAGNIYKVGTQRLPFLELFDQDAQFTFTEKTNIKGGAEFGGYKLDATTVQPGSFLRTIITKSESGNVRSFASVTDNLFPKAGKFKYIEETMSMDRLVTSPETKTYQDFETITAKPLNLGVGYKLGKAKNALLGTKPNVQPDWTGMQAGYLNENLGASLGKFNTDLDKKIGSFSSDVKGNPFEMKGGAGSQRLATQSRARASALDSQYLYTVDVDEGIGFKPFQSLSPFAKTGMGSRMGMYAMTKAMPRTGVALMPAQGTKSALDLDTSIVTKTALQTGLALAPRTITKTTPVNIAALNYESDLFSSNAGEPILKLKSEPYSPSRKTELFYIGKKGTGTNYFEKKNPFNINFLEDLK